MAGNLTNLLAVFLPVKVVNKIEDGAKKAVLNLKYPKAIEYQIYETDWNYGQKSLATKYLNPRYPSLRSGKRFVRRYKYNAILHDNDRFNKYDILPKCFFENRGIGNGRIPFDYWFPKWWRHIRGWFIALGIIVTGVTIGIILSLVIK